jgi:DNA primase
MIILDEFRNRLPAKRKHTPSGWESFNAPCCSYRGHKADKRMRGGFRPSGDGGWVFSCFNCGFKASWMPGRVLSLNAKKFLEYLGTSKEEINKINFNCMKTKSSSTDGTTQQKIENRKIDLPEGAKSFLDWAENPTEEFLKVVGYITERNEALLNWHDYYWTPDTKYNMNKRVIIPFNSPNSDWLNGYSARTVDESVKPKYIASVSNNAYLFGQENLYKPNRKFVIVTEGIFDAISIDGVAVMKQYFSDRQLLTIKTCDKKIIVVPDRDDSGKTLVTQAIEKGFSVSFPDWEDDIKDVADAVKKYGRLATLRQIIDSAEDSALKIQIKMKGWFHE